MHKLLRPAHKLLRLLKADLGQMPSWAAAALGVLALAIELVSGYSPLRVQLCPRAEHVMCGHLRLVEREQEAEGQREGGTS